MRSRSKKNSSMRLGQTIVAEREYVESESERMLARKKAHRRQTTSVLIVALMLLILGLAFYLGMKELAITPEIGTDRSGIDYQIKAEIIDEDRRGQISSRVEEYVANLEQDLQELGLRLKRVTLPTGMSRALYIDIDGQEAYFKVDIDRNAAVTAEDIDRMSRYLKEKDLHPSYADVRVEGKAYYK